MSQYFSNAPRDYPHQQPGKVIPKVIHGSVKRLDNQSNTQGSWNRLIERTQDFHVCSDPSKQTQYRARMVEEFKNGRDNIFPSQPTSVNELNSPASQRKMFSDIKSNENNTGGIINQLKRQDTDQYIPHKTISNTLHRQTESTTDLASKNPRRMYQQSEEKHYSQIRSLPGQAYREAEEIRVNSAVEERNKGLGLLATRSQISNLPCSDLGRIDRQPEKTQRSDLYHIRMLETTPEVYQNANLVEQNFERKQPHTIENTKHCTKEYDLISQNISLKKFPEKKDNLFRMAHEKEVINPDSITGTRKQKARNDPFHSHFKLG